MEDAFVQCCGSVDILWVVGGTEAMLEPQDRLAADVGAFVVALDGSGADYQVGVISASIDSDDPNRGQLLGDPPFLVPGDDVGRELGARLRMGSGGGEEDALLAAIAALAPGGLPGDFVRDEASLLVITATAAEVAPRPEELVPAGDSLDALAATKDDSFGVVLSALLSDADPGPDETGSRHDPAAIVARLTGGAVCDLDAPELGACLAGIGGLFDRRTVFQLSGPARPPTIRVEVRQGAYEPWARVGEDAEHGWTYREETWEVVFGPGAVPGRDAEIRVGYVPQR